MAKKNVVQIAKGGRKTGTSQKKTTPVQKKEETAVVVEAPVVDTVVVETPVVETPRTPEEERTLKAKKAVEDLMEGLDFEPKKEGDTKTTSITTEQKEGIEWLQEQVGLLSDEAERLRWELAQAKEDYTKIFQQLQNKNGNPNNMLNDTLVENILSMFNELQDNMLGRNPERTPHDIVKIEYLLRQMMVMFPFTEQYKKFR